MDDFNDIVTILHILYLDKLILVIYNILKTYLNYTESHQESIKILMLSIIIVATTDKMQMHIYRLQVVNVFSILLFIRFMT